MFLFSLVAAGVFSADHLSAQGSKPATDGGKKIASAKPAAKHYYIDVHELGAGKVKCEDVAKAHAKDLAVEGRYNTQFIKYWVDEEHGKVYCLSSTTDPGFITKTHAEAHGLLPSGIYPVTPGKEAKVKKGQNFFFDVHEMGPGKVKAADVVGVHQKDVATQAKYHVNFVNYWVDEKDGMVFCLSQAPDSSAVINTHREAHGLLPTYIGQVKQGQ
ncbi:MAG: DUF4242 domain-containing protein [Bacteroidetes bacterium]|nr:DUF4242 domain-containing protein [Bacteroidota bacterium]